MGTYHARPCIYKGDGNATRHDTLRDAEVSAASRVAEGEMAEEKDWTGKQTRRRLAWGGGAGVPSSLLTATAEGETVHDGHTFNSPRPTNMYLCIKYKTLALSSIA